MEEAVGGEGLDRLQRRLEDSGVHPNFVTQTFLEASELGDARSLKERLDSLPLEERRAF
ncbi:INVS, partial [Symbiodinium sp. CCMP2456]